MNRRQILNIISPKIILKRLTSISLRSKFILFFFLIALLPFVTFGIITYSKSGEVIANSLAHNRITQFNTSLDTYLQSNLDSLNYIFSNPQFSEYYSSIQRHNYLKKSYGYSYIQVPNFIEQKSSVFSGFYFFTKSNVFYSTNHYTFLFSRNKYITQDWYMHTLDLDSEFNIFEDVWQNTITSTPKATISIARVLKNPYTEENIGVIKFDLKTDLLNNIVKPKSVLNNPNTSLFIVDSNNNFIYSNSFCREPALKYRKVLLKFAGNSGISTVSIDNRKMYVVFETSQLTGWKTFCVIPVSDVSKNLVDIKNTFIIMTIISLFIILILSLATSSILLKPLKRLIDAMGEVEKGNFSTRLVLKNKDETKFLADSFNKMTTNIENLINKVYYAELKQRDAELHSLQNQINPHFLYNTLESIRGVALINNVPSVAMMSKSLSLLFRYSIDRKILVSFKEELDHLLNYFAIQNFRHDDKFEIKYDIPDELMEYSVLKLSLQPIVENSIKHGLEMKLGKGMVEIYASISDNIIRVTISDNGKGISIDKIHELNKLFEETTLSQFDNKDNILSTGIGLLNVNSRLKLHFGNRFGLKFLIANVGTSLEITFPAIKSI